MRIDKRNSATYTKELDEMEKYFLNMFKRFIENDDGFLDESVESIITEAVKRAKKEIIFETSAGVLSINNMSGVVNLTLDDLGGEPKIAVKYSAFNRPFGSTEDTVCEGNDPRLSDARAPLDHNHDNLYYEKFETATETQNGYMDRLDKIKLDGIQENANNYSHPSGSGYNHIPAGGSSGQYLTWHNDGEAEWANLTLNLNKVTTTADGIMSKEDKIKLDGIAANANNYVHPSTHPATIITTDPNHQFVTNDQINEWSTKPVGNDGQVYYMDGDNSTNIKPGYILCKASMIENDQELEDAKLTLVDPSIIYNSWYRFSHDLSENQPAEPEEITDWTYDSENKKIVCGINSGSYIGFISPDKYDNYDLEVTLSSTDGDNDAIGVVVAFTKDDSGREYTLSVIRSRGFDSHVLVENYQTQYTLVYNYCRSDEKMISYVSISSDTQGGWSDIPNGIRLKVVRNGDSFKIYTSDMNSTIIDSATEMSVDLNSDSLLTKFKGVCSYGYSCLSQFNASFSDIKLDKDIKYIYDSRNNETWVADSSGTWNIDTSIQASSNIGIGKFVFNEATKKLFYINGTNDIVSFSSDYVKKSEIDSYIDARLTEKGLLNGGASNE